MLSQHCMHVYNAMHSCLSSMSSVYKGYHSTLEKEYHKEQHVFKFQPCKAPDPLCATIHLRYIYIIIYILYMRYKNIYFVFFMAMSRPYSLMTNYCAERKDIALIASPVLKPPATSPPCAAPCSPCRERLSLRTCSSAANAFLWRSRRLPRPLLANTSAAERDA